jgi:hypothetical protein
MMLKEGFLPEDLDKRQAFTKVFLNRGQSGLELTVVGEAAIIGQKLHRGTRELLKG